MPDWLLKQRIEAARAKLVTELVERVQQLPEEKRQAVIIDALINKATAGGYALEGEIEAAIELLAEYPKEMVNSALDSFGKLDRIKKEDVVWVKSQLSVAKSRHKV